MDADSPHIESLFSVSYGYRVTFTSDVFAPDNPVLADQLRSRAIAGRPVRCLALVDEGLAAATPGLTDRMAAYAEVHADRVLLPLPPVCLPGGEGTKRGLETVLRVVALGVEAGICRQSVVIAVGGGAFLDAVGLGAALLHRGVSLLRLPSTVLSQNDSGIGVKNGVNLHGMKNALGTFAPPLAVINDSRFLRTLSPRDWTAGIAEAFKVAAIRDAGFLDWLENHAEQLAARNMAGMETLIRRCAALHCNHIASSGDPFETGSARPLDFGHWAAHRLETLTDYALRHGEAVAIGIALDLLYAARRGYILHAEALRVIRAMARCGLPVWHAALGACHANGIPAVLDGIEEFRLHLGGRLHVTFPCPLGSRREVTEIDRSLMRDCITELTSLHERPEREAPP
ncbi:MAG: 3-dehydroquinate synthase [Lentisphaeria bacterium]|nr:3-dehydroquinate synthase [Lentisphaeria bacterium]